jgi:hypothetical protein
MNLFLKSIFIITIYLISQQTIFAQDNDKLVSIVVSGTGKTQEEAKDLALRSAIEQTFGTFISTKTELLNNRLLTDQITSMSNGNIQSFEILNELQLPNGNWGTTIKALVSISKLSDFVSSKGVAIEIKGGLFSLNIKQQLLDEKAEEKSIFETVSILHDPMQLAFDFVIKSSDPQSTDSASKNWKIPIQVTATTNKNIDVCSSYLINALKAISLKQEEVEKYESLNKAVYTISIFYKNEQNLFKLRRLSSLNTLKIFINQWSYYTRLFTVESGMDEITGLDASLNKEISGSIYNLTNSNYFELSQNYKSKLEDYYNLQFENGENKFYLLTEGKVAAIYSWNDERNLQQIEKMTGYIVKAKGISSTIKNGGIVVYEKNGHGLVVALNDLGPYKWIDGKKVCDELNYNGYSDWYMPSKDEFTNIYKNLIKYNIGGFAPESYWTSTLEYSQTDPGGHVINYYYYLVSKNRTRELFGKDASDSLKIRTVRSF